jgi:Crp-like helix-turn-helix domain
MKPKEYHDSFRYSAIALKISFLTFGRVLDRTAAASVNRLRYDGMRDRANNKGRHHPRHPRRAGVCRTIYRAPLGSQQSRRLARILLLLANFGKEGRPEPIIAKISQETLAEMIGTTRSRVSFFMNKFRELGLIDYNGGIEVHSSLLNLVLHDQPQIKT